MKKIILLASVVCLSNNAFAKMNNKDKAYHEINKFYFNGISKEELKKLDVDVVDGVRNIPISMLSNTRNLPSDAVITTDRDYTYLQVDAKYASKDDCVNKVYNEVVNNNYIHSVSCKTITDNDGSYRYDRLKPTKLTVVSDDDKNCPIYLNYQDSFNADFNPFKRYYKRGDTAIYGDIQTQITCSATGAMNYRITDAYRNQEIELSELKTFKFFGLKLPDDTKIESDNKTFIKIDARYDKVSDCSDVITDYFYRKYQKYETSCSVNDSWSNGCNIEINRNRLEMKFNPNRYDRKISGDIGDWYLKAECKSDRLLLESRKLK